MGRRDEPKLDELKRLLRRLESLEADHGAGKAAAPGTTSRGKTGVSAGRRSSAAPVLAGAAAVGAIVVGVLFWSDGGQRLGITLATGPTDRASMTPSTGPDAGSTSLGAAQDLLQRADLQVRDGNHYEARRLLEQAAERGSGIAALTLGAMYDPARVAESQDRAVEPDATLARAWYERARVLGVVEASDRLAELASK